MPQTIVDPRDAAESVGLKYVSDGRPGIRRKKGGDWIQLRTT
jgi:DNA topoisomerase-1